MYTRSAVRIAQHSSTRTRRGPQRPEIHTFTSSLVSLCRIRSPYFQYRKQRKELNASRTEGNETDEHGVKRVYALPIFEFVGRAATTEPDVHVLLAEVLHELGR